MASRDVQLGASVERAGGRGQWRKSDLIQRRERWRRKSRLRIFNMHEHAGLGECVDMTRGLGVEMQYEICSRLIENMVVAVD